MLDHIFGIYPEILVFYQHHMGNGAIVSNGAKTATRTKILHLRTFIGMLTSFAPFFGDRGLISRTGHSILFTH